MERLRGINVSKVADSITMENRLKKLSANRERNAGVKKEELPLKMHLSQQVAYHILQRYSKAFHLQSSK